MLLRSLIGGLLALACSATWAFSVVFLNPGKSDEKFWVSVSQFMQAAAHDLGIQLEVLYAERDSVRMIDNAKAVAARQKKPDYLLAVNEKLVAPEIIRLTATSGIKVFLINNTLTDAQKREVGEARSGAKHWIGSLEPNNEDAGYRMANALIAEGKRLNLAQDGKLNLIAVSGDKSTGAAVDREAGLKRALGEHPEVRFRQLVYGEWNQARAREQVDVLLARYPDTQLVWSANDLMAFGAIEAAEKRGYAVGQKLLFTGLNNSVAAMEARASGRLSVLATGHFTTGGWAMVLLYDYHHGKDFAEVGPIHRVEPLFVLLDATQAKRFLEVFGEGRFAPVDFRAYSRVRNPGLKEYRFSVLPLLK